MKKHLLMLCIMMLTLSGCSSSKSGANLTLKEVYSNYFTIGAAVNQYNIDSPLLTKHFNSITCENDMKWSQIHPNINSYKFGDADKYVEFAKANGFGIRGHALVWHEAIGNWVFKDGDNYRSKEEILEIEKDHIKQTITHFGDSLYCWDVCNEVIDENTTPMDDKGSNIYRKSEWFNTCGRDFILVAYQTADAVLRELGIRDKVKLYYNDYGNSNEVKKEKTIAMLKWIQSVDKNIIDGIGLQCHYHLGNFNIDDLRQSIIDYASLGLDVQITEFDCEIYDNNYTYQSGYDYFDEVPDEEKEIHAAVYDRAFEVFRELGQYISNVTFWGVSDAVCYMNNNKNFKYPTNFPYIFDPNDKPKGSFYDIVEFNLARENRTYKPYVRVEQEISNKYLEDGKDFHISDFCDDGTNAIDYPSYDGQVYKVKYNKGFGKEYANINTSIQGHLADFTYINILASGTPGKGVTLRMYYGDSENEKHNILGDDVSFSLTEAYSIHTLKFKGTLKTRADLARTIAIFPEIGLSGNGVSGVFYYKDIWFSKTIPTGATLENPGVDSGDTTVTVNGWSTQAWTKYTLYNAGNEKTGLTYKSAAEWAYIEKPVDILNEENTLTFSFENLIEDDRLSISSIRFMLRGDVSKHISEGVEYEYDEYYGGIFYSYNPNREGEFQPDPETGLVTIKASLNDALEQIGPHHLSGYRLVLLIESHPDDYGLYALYPSGKMVIHDTILTKEVIVEDPYSQYGMSYYTLTEKPEVDRNVTYTNILGSDYWPRLVRKIETNHDDTIEVKIRNNLESEVVLNMHAGIYYDERSDTTNNMFYPLWSNNNWEKNKEGYFIDGQLFQIEGLAEITITISCDENVEANDSINCIQFLFDNCRGDKLNYSGDLDIVSVEII